MKKIMSDYGFESIERDADINRLLKACACKEADRVPSHEHATHSKVMTAVFGEDRIKEIIKSEEQIRTLYYLSLSEKKEDFNITGSMLLQFWEEKSFPWMSWMLPPEAHLEFCKNTAVDCAVPNLSLQTPHRNVLVSTDVTWDQKGMKERYLKKLKFPENQPEKMMEFIDWYVDVFKNSGVGVGPICNASFTSTYELLGMEKFLVKLKRDRKTIEYYMDLFNDYAVQITKGLAQRNIDCFWLSDDLCTNHGLMARPKLIKELWIDRTEEIIKPIRQKGIPIYMHCCGNIKELIPIVLNLGISAMQAIQPNCNDIYAYKKEYGEELAFIGNIDLGGVLCFGTPEEVAEDVKKHIDRLAEGGGYCVGSSHCITNKVPLENYIAMIKTTQSYGRY